MGTVFDEDLQVCNFPWWTKPCAQGMPGLPDVVMPVQGGSQGTTVQPGSGGSSMVPGLAGGKPIMSGQGPLPGSEQGSSQATGGQPIQGSGTGPLDPGMQIGMPVGDLMMTGFPPLVDPMMPGDSNMGIVQMPETDFGSGMQGQGIVSPGGQVQPGSGVESGSMTGGLQGADGSGGAGSGAPGSQPTVKPPFGSGSQELDQSTIAPGSAATSTGTSASGVGSDDSSSSGGIVAGTSGSSGSASPTPGPGDNNQDETSGGGVTGGSSQTQTPPQDTSSSSSGGDSSSAAPAESSNDGGIPTQDLTGSTGGGDLSATGSTDPGSLGSGVAGSGNSTGGIGGSDGKYKVMDGSIFDCPYPGFFPFESNCLEFYVCLEVLPGILFSEQLFKCPDRYLFDDATRRCQRENRVNCTKFSVDSSSQLGKETVLVVLEQFLDEFFNTPLHYRGNVVG